MLISYGKRFKMPYGVLEYIFESAFFYTLLINRMKNLNFLIYFNNKLNFYFARRLVAWKLCYNINTYK